jgi:hypothetical protein
LSARAFNCRASARLRAFQVLPGEAARLSGEATARRPMQGSCAGGEASVNCPLG